MFWHIIQRHVSVLVGLNSEAFISNFLCGRSISVQFLSELKSDGTISLFLWE